MGEKLFGVDIAKVVHDAMSSGLTDVVLVHYTPGTRDATDPTAGNEPTSTRHTAKGFRDEYLERQIDGTNIRRGDRKVVLIAESINPPVAPAPGDEVTHLGVTARIVGDGFRDSGVATDPAGATYVCQVRAY